MNLREYISRFRKVRRELYRTQTRRALGVALDTLAQTKLRVQQTGENYRGASFVPYTRLYAQERSRAGYQVSFVDFTRTGRLWNSVNAFPVSQDGGKTVLEVRPRDNENQAKLDGQFRKRGNILRPSEDELNYARQIWQRRVLNEMNPIR